jgi:hypothetical protein
MPQLLVASIGFIPWVLYIIITYYSKNFSLIDHIESVSGYGGYLLSVGVCYGIYKFISLMRDKKTVRIWFWHILGFSILQLLIVSVSYTASQSVVGSPFFGPGGLSSVVLFWHSLSLLLYPIYLGLLWRTTGYAILKYIPTWKSIDMRIRIGAEIAIGLAIFTLGLLILGVMHLYTLPGLLVVCGILTIASWTGWQETYRDIRGRRVEFEQHTLYTDSLLDIIRPRLLTAEFAFLIVSFLVSVALINVIRPMPIGWDDLGVYMNYPRIMAITGSALTGAGMYTWQLITGSGFLWDQIAAQAFYVNQLGGIFSLIILTSVLSYMLERKWSRYLLSLPLLLAGIYYIMPMTVFQQAKDMKLDPGLMMISVSAFGLLWYTITQDVKPRISYFLIGIVGVIVGIAFTIKFTTLILIIAVLALISYRILSIAGFFGFFAIFLAIFTGGGLWTKMNVWMPVENTGLIHMITFSCAIVGLASLIVAWYQHGRSSMKQWFVWSLICIVGVGVALAPWMVKNGNEVLKYGWKITIDSLLGGASEPNVQSSNYSPLYTPSEYATKKKEQQSSSITSDGKSQNEDFSRYFGQESGLNNYLKLPANLTFQKNQSGEFTDITFLFLAFFPALLLFVRWRRFYWRNWTQWIYPGSVFIGMGFILYYCFGVFGTKTPALMEALQSIVWAISLPLGYAVLIAIVLVSIFLIHFCIEKNKDNQSIQSVFIMLMVYGFLFLISAFGIVWYGVFVYFLFLALFGLVALTFIVVDPTDDEDMIGVKTTISIIFFLFILVYIVRSAFPHGWFNLTTSGMNEYKYEKLDQNQSIFTYRSDYITPIATMNTIDPHAVTLRAAALAESKTLKSILTPERLALMGPSELNQVLTYFIQKIATGGQFDDKKTILSDINRIGHELYTSILSPKWSDVNSRGIYRIGTFMTYLIHENRKRYLEDSLVFEFETFFYDPSPEKTIDRMKKVGLWYLLTDLNAATIDRDPRHVLTNRFEHLLLTMRAKNLKLVDTDNLCLRLALDEYKAWRLQSEDEFIDIAGTNYESYRSQSGTTISINRGIKQNKCANYAIGIFNANTQSGSTIPPYLIPVQQALASTKTEKEQGEVLGRAFGQSYFALFEIE